MQFCPRARGRWRRKISLGCSHDVATHQNVPTLGKWSINMHGLMHHVDLPCFTSHCTVVPSRCWHTRFFWFFLVLRPHKSDIEKPLELGRWDFAETNGWLTETNGGILKSLARRLREVLGVVGGYESGGSNYTRCLSGRGTGEGGGFNFWWCGFPPTRDEGLSR